MVVPNRQKSSPVLINAWNTLEKSTRQSLLGAMVLRLVEACSVFCLSLLGRNEVIDSSATAFASSLVILVGILSSIFLVYRAYRAVRLRYVAEMGLQQEQWSVDDGTRLGVYLYIAISMPGEIVGLITNLAFGLGGLVQNGLLLALVLLAPYCAFRCARTYILIE